MHNRYPFWKYLLILIVLGIATIYAFPNLYPDDPAVQISNLNQSKKVTQAELIAIENTLKAKNIPYKRSELTEKYGLIRFHDAEQQIKAQPIIKQQLGDDFVVALNLAPTTPEWLQKFGASPIKLGLDLSGGVHFVMEVDIEKALKQRYEDYTGEIKRLLRENNWRYTTVAHKDTAIEIKLKNDEDITSTKSELHKQFPEFLIENETKADGLWLKLTVTEQKIREIEDYAVTQNLTTLRNRINELGVAEPLVQRQGRNRIVIELPGVQDTAQAKRILGKTANLEFRLEAGLDESTYNTERFPFRTEKNQFATLERNVILKGENVVNAQSNFDENGSPAVFITLDSVGGNLMYKTTQHRINHRMAVLFIEQKTKTTYSTDASGKTVASEERYEEKSIISLATIRSALGRNFQITGLDSPAESAELALLLRAGALAAPMYFVEERTIGPSLGHENIQKGIFSTLIGGLAVVTYMLIAYRLFGLFANIALACNVFLIIAIMSMIPGAVLTLPGIAGIVLTIGMAVDANVLICSRIREELRNGMSPHAAISAGYDRAFITIFDSNLTTLLTALILFGFGSGPIKGFAVSLSIGILTSMFTAVMVTRALISLFIGGRPLRQLPKLIL